MHFPQDANDGEDGGRSAGERRILRLLQRLQYAEEPQHAALLTAIGSAQVCHPYPHPPTLIATQ